MIDAAHSVDALIDIITPSNWREGVIQAQQYCIVNVITVNSAMTQPMSLETAKERTSKALGQMKSPAPNQIKE
jgi:hypothetical protein